jgi:hypothetical protein
VDASPEPEVVIASYPKSGRTWLRVLLGKALCLGYALHEELLLDTPALTRAAGVPETGFSHCGADLREGASAVTPADIDPLAGKRVVLLVRDPRDVLVSSYFEATRRSFVFGERPLQFEGTLSQFVRSPVLGARKLASFNRAWVRAGPRPKRLLVRYEDLHADPAASLRRVLAFLGAGRVNDHQINVAVEHARIDNLRRLERGGAFADPCLQPGDPRDPDSFKARRGVVGGYRDFLRPADVAYVGRVFGHTR